MYPTKAFNTFVTDRFIDYFDEFLSPNYYNADYTTQEFMLQSALCKAMAARLEKCFKFEEVKDNYNKKLINISSQLSMQETNEIINNQEKRLKYYAKLKYCLEQVKNNDYGINVLKYLFTLFIKMKKLPIEAVKTTKEYSYINQASIELSNNSIKNLVCLPDSVLLNELFKTITLIDYYYQNLQDINSFVEDSSFEEEVYYNDTINNIDKKILDQAENYFEDWLIVQMHTLNNGMVF